MKKRIKQVGAILLSLILLLCGCGTSGASENTGKTADGKTEVVLWHTWGTKNAAHVQEMADEFNASQEQWTVTLVNQANASMIRQKLAILTQDEYPAIFCGTPTTTCYYDNIDYVKPLQDFLDNDEDDWTAPIYSSIKTAYSDLEGNMIGAPFGVSSEGFFVNVDIIKQAGYTLDDFTSFEKITEIAKAVVNKGLCKYGISFHSTNVNMLNMLTMQGIDVLDNDNGYSGEATKSLFMEGETNSAIEKAMKLYASLYEEGVAYAYGSDVSGTTLPSFYNGTLAICGATNSFSHYIVDNGVDFEYAFVPTPGIDSNAKYQGQALTEGTGFYITNSGNEKQMEGAYEFIKFVAQPENQATWCSELGYIPYTEEAATQQVYVDWVTTYFPSLLELRTKIQNSSSELRGPYTVVPDNILEACGFLYNYVSTDPTGNLQEYMEEASAMIDEAIEIQALRK